LVDKASEADRLAYCKDFFGKTDLVKIFDRKDASDMSSNYKFKIDENDALCEDSGSIIVRYSAVRGGDPDTGVESLDGLLTLDGSAFVASRRVL
jgi:hypothetical protein